MVGERWTLLILRDAFFGVRRVNDFHAHLDAPRTVLSTRLQGLVDTGALERRPGPQHAGPSLSELTPARPALWPARDAVHALGPPESGGDDGPRAGRQRQEGLSGRDDAPGAGDELRGG